MNETELLRRQLALERDHAAAVIRACVAVATRPAPRGDGDAQRLEAAAEYLARALASFDERDQRLAETGRSRFPPDGSAARELEAALRRPGSGRDVLARFEAARAPLRDAAGGADAHARWRAVGHAFAAEWLPRRAALDALLGTLPRVEDWRRVAAIDADAILDERRRYETLQPLLGAGAAPATPSPQGD